MSAIVALAVDALSQALKYIVEHPEAAAKLVKSARSALSDAHDADALPEAQKVARMTAIASGLAAARANAVQEFQRRKATKTSTPKS